MRILLSNDDGFDAPGLLALKAALEDSEHDIWTVAPAQNSSGFSHMISIEQSLAVQQISSQYFKCYGSPADSVRIAILACCPRPDLVISGINDGLNLGVDLNYSGTIAAAREAVLLAQIPAIAISQASSNDFSASVNFILQHALELSTRIEADSFLNINVPPNPQASVLTILGKKKYINTIQTLSQDKQVTEYIIKARVNNDLSLDVSSDVEAIANAKISISPISTISNYTSSISLTNYFRDL